MRPLDRAGPEALSLAVTPRYAEQLKVSRAGAVLVPDALAGPTAARHSYRRARPLCGARAGDGSAVPVLRRRAGRRLDGAHRRKGASSASTCRSGRSACSAARFDSATAAALAEGVSLGDGVTVGEDTVIGPRVVCYRDSRIGRRVVLKAGAVIGGDGFGYLSDCGGHHRIPHVGICIIEDEVEIGSNSTVDRGSVDDTVVGRGTKLDNLVHVGHNVRIGERCLLMAGVGRGGKHAAGQRRHSGRARRRHRSPHDRAMALASRPRALSSATSPPAPSFSGHPARPHRQFLRAQAALYRLAPIIDERRAAGPVARRR